ncbi:hypothetical protein D9M69_679980 [compost metagenome]
MPDQSVAYLATSALYEREYPGVEIKSFDRAINCTRHQFAGSGMGTMALYHDGATGSECGGSVATCC